MKKSKICLGDMMVQHSHDKMMTGELVEESQSINTEDIKQELAEEIIQEGLGLAINIETIKEEVDLQTEFHTIADDVGEKTTQSTLQKASPLHPKRNYGDYEAGPRSSPLLSLPSKKIKTQGVIDYDEDGADDEKSEMARQQPLHASTSHQQLSSSRHLGPPTRLVISPSCHHEPPESSLPSSMPVPSSLLPSSFIAPAFTSEQAPRHAPMSPSYVLPPMARGKIRFADEIAYRIPVRSIKEMLTPQYFKQIVFTEMREHETNFLVMILNATNESLCDVMRITAASMCTLLTVMCSFRAEIEKIMPKVREMPSIDLLQRMHWIWHHLENGIAPSNYCVDLSAYKINILRRFREEQRRIWSKEENIGKDITEELSTSWPPIMKDIYMEHFETRQQMENGGHNNPTDNLYSTLLHIVARGDIQNVVKEAQELSRIESFYETQPHDRNFYKSVVFIEICRELEREHF